MQNETGSVPILDGNLRSHNVRMPEGANEASGIKVLGRTIRSLVYTTDIAIIRNCDADAVFAVYPFTPQQIISKMLVEASSIPVFVGVGGGTTSGARSAILARDAEAAGAYGVVLNSPASNMTVEMVSRVVDIPVVVTVVNDDPDVVRSRIESGASMINVAGGRNTAEIVCSLREHFCTLPIIATGGKTGESLAATAKAGANAVIWTPPSNSELFSPMMESYRATVGARSRSVGARPLSNAARAEVLEDIRRLKGEGLLLDS